MQDRRVSILERTLWILAWFSEREQVKVPGRKGLMGGEGGGRGGGGRTKKTPLAGDCAEAESLFPSRGGRALDLPPPLL